MGNDHREAAIADDQVVLTDRERRAFADMERRLTRQVLATPVAIEGSPVLLDDGRSRSRWRLHVTVAGFVVLFTGILAMAWMLIVVGFLATLAGVDGLRWAGADCPLANRPHARITRPGS